MNKITSVQTACKAVLIYCLGLFIMAIGISFSIISDLGVSPISSIPYVLSQIFDLDLGLCTTAIFLLFIFIQFLMLGRDFRLKHLLQILCSTLFGVFVSVATWLTSPIKLGGFYPLRLLFCGISIVLIAIGILLYLSPNLISLPGEGVMQAMSLKLHIPLPRSKTIFDCTVVVIAALLSVLFLHSVIGVREGTVLAAVFVGMCLKFLQKRFSSPISRFIYGKDAIYK